MWSLNRDKAIAETGENAISELFKSTKLQSGEGDDKYGTGIYEFSKLLKRSSAQ
jgi:hypothetical protein